MIYTPNLKNEKILYHVHFHAKDSFVYEVLILVS